MTASPITAIDAIPLRIPLKPDLPGAALWGAPLTAADSLLVKVTTSDGVVGWGEAFGLTAVDLADRNEPDAAGQQQDEEQGHHHGDHRNDAERRPVDGHGTRSFAWELCSEARRRDFAAAELSTRTSWLSVTFVWSTRCRRDRR